MCTKIFTLGSARSLVYYDKNAPSSDANSLPPTGASAEMDSVAVVVDDVSADLWIILVLKYLAR